jgi:VWFA-related protein
MFTRHLLLPLLLVLLSVSAPAQRGGGGGGRSSAPSSAQPNYNAGTNEPGTSTPDVSSITETTADKEGKIEYRSETILIQVPVIVTDKSGNHIHGLSKDTFHVLENGQEQKISAFEEVVATNAKLPVVTPQPGEFSNLTLSEQQPRTVTVIALDTVNTPFLDQTIGRQELVKYLAANIDSGQVLALMIITSHGLKIVQGLTADPAQLMAVLKKVGSETPALQTVSTDAQANVATGDIPDIPMITPNSDPTAVIQAFVERGDTMYAQFQQANAIETTLNGFLGIAWSLSGIPGRKSLIWATGGFPFQISSPATVPGGYLSTLYERTMEALTAAQISVYPVDVRGLMNTFPMGGASQPRSFSGQGLSRSISNRSWLQDSTNDTLNEFAGMTGGKAFYNTNDLATSFKRAADDASSYYLLGYYLNKTNNHAGWRQLKVKVDTKDTEVRAREGFFVTNATLHLDLTRTSDVTYALSSPIEGTGVPVTMKWLGVTDAPKGGKKEANFQIHLPPNGVSINGGDNRIDFDLAVAAFANNSKDAKPVITTGKTLAMPLSEAQMASLSHRGVDMKNSLELGPGQYTVRVVVRDNVTGKVGSVTAPLTVN